MKISTRFVQAMVFLAYGARIVEAQDACTFLAIVMDESGSMSGEQVFLRDSAMPGVIEAIRIELQTRVFVCSYGYPSGSAFAGRVVGCSAGFDIDDYAFITSGGGTEDGWAAIEQADAHAKNLTEIDGIQLSSCSNIYYFMILVTDEDRDNTDNTLTYNSTLKTLKEGDWSLHAILDNRLIPADSLGAVEVEETAETSWKVYSPNEDTTTTTNYTETPVTEYPVGTGCCNDDYATLAFETKGAVWDLSKLRGGGFVAQAFTQAFIAVTSELIIIEIEENPGACDIGDGGILAILFWPFCIILDFFLSLLGFFGGFFGL